MAWVKERITSDGDKRYVACYRDPEGRQRSAGTFSSRRAAERAAQPGRAAGAAPAPGTTTPCGEVTLPRVRRDRLAALQARRDLPPGPRTVSNLDKHFYPVLRPKQLHQITPRPGPGLGHHRPPPTACRPRSIRKYHTMLHSIFDRAVRDRADRGQPVRAHRAAQGHRHEDPHPDPRGVRRPHRRHPGPAPADGRDRHRDRDALGRAHRPQAPPHRLPAPHAHRRGDHRGGLQEALPHRRTLRRQALPQGQRTPHLRRRARTGSTQSPTTSTLTTSAATTCSSPPRAGTPISRNTFRTRIWQPAVKASRRRLQRPRSTTCATPTPPGCSPAAPTSSPSWTAWATPRSRPPRSTSTPSPTPTRRTSTALDRIRRSPSGRGRSPPANEPRRSSPFKPTSAPVTPEWTPSVRSGEWPGARDPGGHGPGPPPRPAAVPHARGTTPRAGRR